MAGLLGTSALVALVLAAGWYDVRENRVPNPLTVSGLLAGLALSALPGGVAPGSSLGAAALCCALGLALFSWRIVGGGDVKLLVAVAAFLGIERLGLGLTIMALAGLVLCAAVAFRARVLLPAVLNAWELTSSAVKVWRPSRAEVPLSGLTVPYALAIGVGAVGAWFLRAV